MLKQFLNLGRTKLGLTAQTDSPNKAYQCRHESSESDEQPQLYSGFRLKCAMRNDSRLVRF